MDFANYFPIYEKLTSEEQALLAGHARLHTFEKDTMLHNGSNDCLGLVLIKSGQLRAFITSEEGREITIYRLFDRDMCLFSASCMMNSIQFDISVTAEKDTKAWIIPKTEDLMPYIPKKMKIIKWSATIIGFAIIALIISTIMSNII